MLRRLLNRWRGRHRALFRWDDGTRYRRSDPLRVCQLLQVHPHYRPDHLDAAQAGDHLAQRIVADAACDVFGVHPYNDQTDEGMTEAERIQLMLEFDIYLEALKKNTNPSPTVPSSTGATSSGSSEPITSDLSDSGPPAIGESSATPKASAWES